MMESKNGASEHGKVLLTADHHRYTVDHADVDQSGTKLIIRNRDAA